MSDSKPVKGLKAPLTQTFPALESARDSGFDLASSVGEIVDNSIQANATRIRIKTVEAEDGSAIVKMAFADNGDGIPLDYLASVLSLGYSSRYNSRTGMGRFGVGLKLASLALSRCVEVYTKTRDGAAVYCTALDLDAVRSGEQTELTVREVTGFPEEFAGLMADPAGTTFASGTLVVWADIDRLPIGGGNGRARSARDVFADKREVRKAQLEKYLARTYRAYLAKGIAIELDGLMIDLYDPTFQLHTPRMVRQFGEDLRGKIIQETDEKTVVIDGHPVHIRVALAPLATRAERGQGARAFEHLFLTTQDSRLDDHNQAISMLREGREIYYALVPQMYPPDKSGSADLDRFIGVEVSFPATLDEYFRVRNVKRGAEPVAELRAKIRDFIRNPIIEARKQIREDWERAVHERHTGPADRGHEHALDVIERSARKMPVSAPKPDASPEREQQVLFDLAEDHGIDPKDDANAEVMDTLRQRFHERAIMITDSGWPGKDMFDIEHLSGKFVLKINHRHPFIRDVYDVVKQMAAKQPTEFDLDEVRRLLMKVDVAFDVLFTAYAKAENMHQDPDGAYGELRSYWGVITAGMLNEGLADL
ncbi:ATP-binding protein [Dactylosporangium cerinum]|uniref:ATP-binding protein n=1 Tax=Dactylosporangium cerinum TaxID=1434730 RepID=A0ABV9VUD5_9ACTN